MQLVVQMIHDVHGYFNHRCRLFYHEQRTQPGSCRFRHVWQLIRYNAFTRGTSKCFALLEQTYNLTPAQVMVSRSWGGPRNERTLTFISPN